LIRCCAGALSPCCRFEGGGHGCHRRSRIVPRHGRHREAGAMFPVPGHDLGVVVMVVRPSPGCGASRGISWAAPGGRSLRSGGGCGRAGAGRLGGRAGQSGPFAAAGPRPIRGRLSPGKWGGHRRREAGERVGACAPGARRLTRVPAAAGGPGFLAWDRAHSRLGRGCGAMGARRFEGAGRGRRIRRRYHNKQMRARRWRTALAPDWCVWTCSSWAYPARAYPALFPMTRSALDEPGSVDVLASHRGARKREHGVRARDGRGGGRKLGQSSQCRADPRESC